MCFKGASLRPTEEILVENRTFYSETNSLKFSDGLVEDVIIRNVDLSVNDGVATISRSLEGFR